MSDDLEASSPLTRAVDMHVHSYPDVLPRRQWDGELADDAEAAGMRALVLKNHVSPTAARARIASEGRRLSVFGGVVLNRAVGGLNPDAVRTTLAMGGRLVWMPTVSASNHLRFLAGTVSDQHVRAISQQGGRGIDVLAEGRLVKPVDEILDLIAEADAVLATGHLSVDEIVAVVHEARRRGVQRIVITHPEAPQIRMGVDVQLELAALGVFFERTYYSVVAGTQTESEMLGNARRVGIDSTILATDLGQEHNPRPVEGFAAFGEGMIAAGMLENEWRTTTRINPARLLGLGSREEAA